LKLNFGHLCVYFCFFFALFCYLHSYFLPEPLAIFALGASLGFFVGGVFCFLAVMERKE